MVLLIRTMCYLTVNRKRTEWPTFDSYKFSHATSFGNKACTHRSSYCSEIGRAGYAETVSHVCDFQSRFR